MEENIVKISLPKGYKVEKVEGDRILIKKIKKKLPTTFEEWVNDNPIKGTEYYLDSYGSILDVRDCPRTRYDYNLLPLEETAEAIWALIKLIRLRDAYRQGWKPDDTNIEQEYYSIVCIGGSDVLGVVTSYYYSYHQLLSFPSKEIAEEFLNNFKDLIEQLKPLFNYVWYI